MRSGLTGISKGEGGSCLSEVSQKPFWTAPNTFWELKYEYPPAVRVVQRPRQGGLWRGSGIESHREPAPQTPLRQLVIVHGVALADSDS